MRLLSLPEQFGEVIINIDRINYMEGTHQHTFIFMAGEEKEIVINLPLYETARLITNFHKETEGL